MNCVDSRASDGTKDRNRTAISDPTNTTTKEVGRNETLADNSFFQPIKSTSEMTDMTIGPAEVRSDNEPSKVSALRNSLCQKPGLP